MRQFDFYFKVFNSRTTIAGAIINCSQTNFVAIILVLSVFFYAIFRLTDFLSDTFRPQKWDKQVAPSGIFFGIKCS